MQYTLPVHHGGLGIHSAVQLASSALLASAATSFEIARLILPTSMQPSQLSYVKESLLAWSQGYPEHHPIIRKHGIL